MSDPREEPRAQTSPRDAVLLVNLGTPDTPTPPSLRRYLAQFLSDRRVVEIPRALWWPILYGIVLNTRPRKSAAKYAKIWTREGSPLRTHTERQTKLLKGYLGNAGHHVSVEFAMRYGEPSIASVLEQLRAGGADHITIVPLYPQYAASATASVFDEVAAWMRRTRAVPAMRLVRSFADHPGYIAALAANVREHWRQHGRAERFLMSFHGIPKRSVDLGDPYYAQCMDTAKLLATALGLELEDYLVTFQSRFGAAEWLQPYTQPTLEKLARDGVKSVDVICPGFVADCLETLEEISMECRTAFLDAGGERFEYIACLNERPEWITALATIADAHRR